MLTIKLHPTEWDLIQKIRNKFRYGEVVIECRDGLPFRVGQTVVYEKLSTIPVDMEFDIEDNIITTE